MKTKLNFSWNFSWKDLGNCFINNFVTIKHILTLLMLLSPLN